MQASLDYTKTMSSSRKKRDEAKRRLQWEKRQPERLFGPGNVDARLVKNLDIHHEIRYIVKRAQAEDVRVVGIENLILFSTNSRDAWMLDPEDDFALCLCRGGEPQSYRIVESQTTFAVDWPARFEIDGETFIVVEKAGRVVTIHGYPTAGIAAECELLKNRSMLNADGTNATDKVEEHK